MGWGTTICETHNCKYTIQYKAHVVMSYIKDITTWAWEHIVKLLSVNTVHLQMIGFCFCLHFKQCPTFLEILFVVLHYPALDIENQTSLRCWWMTWCFTRKSVSGLVKSLQEPPHFQPQRSFTICFWSRLLCPLRLSSLVTFLALV